MLLRSASDKADNVLEEKNITAESAKDISKDHKELFISILTL
jgi:hypothetical protein